MRYDDSSDIFMREPNGEPQVQMPQLVPMDDDEAAGGNAEGLQGEKERTYTPYEDGQSGTC